MDTNVSSANEQREMTLTELKEMVGTEAHDKYNFKVRARKRFRELGYRNYVQMAEVFMELYVASFRTKDPNQWFFKTHEWWEVEHGLSREVVDNARKNLLELGVTEERHWIGYRVEYRLIPANVVLVLWPNTSNGGASLRESRNLVSGKATIQNAEKPPSHRREEEIEKEERGDSPNGSRPSSHRDSFTRKRDGHNDLSSVRSRSSKTTTDERVDKPLAFFEEQLADKDLTTMNLTEQQRFRREVGVLISERNVSPGKLFAVFRRMLEARQRERSFPLMLLGAYDDVEEKSYPDMSGWDWARWVYQGTEPVGDPREYRVVREYDEAVVYEDHLQCLDPPRRTAPEWVRLQYRKIEAEIRAEAEGVSIADAMSERSSRFGLRAVERVEEWLRERKARSLTTEQRRSYATQFETLYGKRAVEELGEGAKVLVERLSKGKVLTVEEALWLAEFEAAAQKASKNPLAPVDQEEIV